MLHMDSASYSTGTSPESSTSPMLSPELQQSFYASPASSASLSSTSSMMMYSESQSTTPLTPAAVSPMSVLYDPIRKYSVDVGPFGYASQQCFDAPFTAEGMMEQPPQQHLMVSPPPPSAKPKQQRSSDAPNVQHKHVCKYAYCGWSFKRYEHLKRHMLVHTGERPHVCHFPGCGKSFSRSDNFHAHCRTHTKKNMMQQQQRRSPSRPKSNIPMTSAPMPTNAMLTQFDYPVYEQRPQQFDYVPNNMAMSTTSLPQQDQFLTDDYFLLPNNNTWPTTSFPSSMMANAPRRASYPITAAAPVAQHKSHVCPVPQCQRRFKRLEHLKRHMRIHTLERPFSCTFPNCHKTFSRSDNLSQHMKTHQRHEDRRKRQLQQQQQQQQHQKHDMMHQPMDEAFLGMANMGLPTVQWNDAPL